MNSIERQIKHQQIRDAGFTDSEITYFDLMSQSEEEICTFLSKHYFNAHVIETLNGGWDCPQREIIIDKLLTQRFLSDLGIDTPQLVGLWHPENGVTKDGRPMITPHQFASELQVLLEDTDQVELFFKPRSGGRGQGIFAATFVKSPTGEVTALFNDEIQSIDVFLANLPETPHSYLGDTNQGWVIQGRVNQHPELARLNPSSLNTIRLNTYSTRPQKNETNEQSVMLDFAFFRAGRAGLDTDNWATGGVMIEINPETGRLNQGRFSNKHGGSFSTKHPDSKIDFVGLKMPFWAETVAMCLKAAKAFPKVRSVAWDVAVTEEGPLIVEGNTQWDVHVPQMLGKGYFSPERRALFEAFGDPTTPTQLPPQRSLPGQSKMSWLLYNLRRRFATGH